MVELIYNSSDVIDSNVVVNSQKISGSRHVFDSSDVIGSIEVVGGNIVKESSQVFASSIVEKSHKILSSSNIIESMNVVDSMTIINCYNVMKSSQCYDSSEIIKSNGLDNCHFCLDCADSTNLMCCNDIGNADYQIFNKPVTKRQFDLFMRQYNDFMAISFAFVPYWPNQSAIVEEPVITSNFKLWYELIPDGVWKWVRTLPGYDPSILYTITMNETFLKEI